MTSKSSSTAAAAGDAAANGPGDKDMRNVILSTLSSATDALRPNKLRKMACKQLKGSTWTQYAKCLETLVHDAVVQRKEKGGETFVVLAKSASKKKVKAAAISTKTSDDKPVESKMQEGDEPTALKEEIRIPRSVALYLHKKRHLKLKNIQTNTKTKLTIFGQLDGGTKQTAESLAELHTLQIIAEFPVLKAKEDKDDEDVEEEDPEETAKKHMKAAKHILQKMVNAQKLNPERFAPKQIGGTFEEQAKREEEQKKRLQMEKEKDQQGRSSHGGKTRKEGGEGSEKQTRRKRAKFY